MFSINSFYLVKRPINIFFFSEVSDVPNDEQETISLSGPTPKEAFEISKRLSSPASPKNKSEVPVKKPVGSVQEDSFKKVSYASVVSSYLLRIQFYL